MNDVAQSRDEYTRNFLVRVLRECGENEGTLEGLSQLELIDCVLEKCMWDTGAFSAFMMRLLITANCDKEVLAARIECSEGERKKQNVRIVSLEEELRTSERERAVLTHRLSMAHKHPGMEGLRLFLSSFKCESCLDDLLGAGIDSIEGLKDAARRKHGLKKAGINLDIAALIRRHLRSV